MNDEKLGPLLVFEGTNDEGAETLGIRGYREFVATMDLVSINGGPYHLPPKARRYAALFAAAPDMMEALENIVALQENQGRRNLVECAAIARAALAKARG